MLMWCVSYVLTVETVQLREESLQILLELRQQQRSFRRGRRQQRVSELRLASQYFSQIYCSRELISAAYKCLTGHFVEGDPVV